jgi:hypothetical protein
VFSCAQLRSVARGYIHTDTAQNRFFSAENQGFFENQKQVE